MRPGAGRSSGSRVRANLNFAASLFVVIRLSPARQMPKESSATVPVALVELQARLLGQE
jgi:hypothetical protein